MKKWKLKSPQLNWIKTGICPCCNVGVFEFINTENNGILVNVESKGYVKIKDFWIPSKVCNNPLCEWSKVDINSLSRVKGWDYINNKGV